MQYYLFFYSKKCHRFDVQKTEDEEFYNFFLKLTHRLKFYNIVK